MGEELEAFGSDEMTPYKIVDATREKRFGVVANSLENLVARAVEKLGLAGSVKVVLEQDGTEVDEEDYFTTLEKNTSLMVLMQDQSWAPPGRRKGESSCDQTDGGRGIQGLLQRLQSDIGQVSLLGGYELELLSDMDPDSLKDIVSDRVFLDQLKEASGRFLSEKRQAQDAMDLLKIYHRQSGGIQEKKKGTLAQ
ncbi:cell death activator CIDE-A-like [Cimex lectularius]|uniref:CIDE-N domain-containing protein n=1 Tax=Cimex lectularius TaxID=79782 RepID=A0A8I6TIA4_CIMLE|nr:cell death activator CIDE-A-like [Cimex lectularius]